MYFLGLQIVTILIFVLWTILLIDYCKHKNKFSLYLLIFLSLSVFLSLLYTYVFNITIPKPYEKLDMFFAGSWICNILYQLIIVIATIKSGLLCRNYKKLILFATFVVITIAIFYYFSAELRLLFYHIFVSHFN